MGFLDLALSRHCVREFLPDPVSDDALEAIVVAAAAAPSSMNSQPTRLHVMTGPARDRLVEVMAMSTVHLQEYVHVMSQHEIELAARFFTTLGDAPMVIALSLPRVDGELDRVNDLVATGAVMENMLLAATEAGLGACPVTFGLWVADELAEVVGIAPDRYVAVLVLFGYAASSPEAPHHRTDIVERVG